MSKGRRKFRYSVLALMPDGTKSKYQFNGKPDFSRVIRETLGEGAVAAMVFRNKANEKEFVFPANFGGSFMDSKNVVGIDDERWLVLPLKVAPDMIQAVRTVYGNGG